MASTGTVNVCFDNKAVLSYYRGFVPAIARKMFLWRSLHLFLFLTQAVVYDFSGFAFGFYNRELVSDSGCTAQSQNFNRATWFSFDNVFVLCHPAKRTRPIQGQQQRCRQCSMFLLDQNVCDRSTTTFHFDSTTAPCAARLGLALRSRISAWRRIASSSLSRFILFLVDNSTHKTSPPISSTWTLCCNRSCLTFIGFASGKSTLLIATIIGTPAAFAWLMASIVCGMIESFAATTKTTISVTFAPRARISVKAAWPGVSRNVIFDCFPK